MIIKLNFFFPCWLSYRFTSFSTLTQTTPRRGSECWCYLERRSVWALGGWVSQSNTPSSWLIIVPESAPFPGRGVCVLCFCPPRVLDLLKLLGWTYGAKHIELLEPSSLRKPRCRLSREASQNLLYSAFTLTLSSKSSQVRVLLSQAARFISS